MWQWLKELIAGKELQKLERYRQAACLARQWNGSIRQSADTAEWITEVGEGRLAANTIDTFREALRENNSQEYLVQQHRHREYMRKEGERLTGSKFRDTGH